MQSNSNIFQIHEMSYSRFLIEHFNQVEHQTIKYNNKNATQQQQKWYKSYVYYTNQTKNLMEYDYDKVSCKYQTYQITDKNKFVRYLTISEIEQHLKIQKGVSKFQSIDHSNILEVKIEQKGFEYKNNFYDLHAKKIEDLRKMKIDQQKRIKNKLEQKLSIGDFEQINGQYYFLKQNEKKKQILERSQQIIFKRNFLNENQDIVIKNEQTASNVGQYKQEMLKEQQNDSLFQRDSQQKENQNQNFQELDQKKILTYETQQQVQTQTNQEKYQTQNSYLQQENQKLNNNHDEDHVEKKIREKSKIIIYQQKQNQSLQKQKTQIYQNINMQNNPDFTTKIESVGQIIQVTDKNINQNQQQNYQKNEIKNLKEQNNKLILQKQKQKQLLKNQIDLSDSLHKQILDLNIQKQQNLKTIQELSQKIKSNEKVNTQVISLKAEKQKMKNNIDQQKKKSNKHELQSKKYQQQMSIKHQKQKLHLQERLKEEEDRSYQLNQNLQKIEKEKFSCQKALEEKINNIIQKEKLLTEIKILKEQKQQEYQNLKIILQKKNEELKENNNRLLLKDNKLIQKNSLIIKLEKQKQSQTCKFKNQKEQEINKLKKDFKDNFIDVRSLIHDYKRKNMEQITKFKKQFLKNLQNQEQSSKQFKLEFKQDKLQNILKIKYLESQLQQCRINFENQKELYGKNKYNKLLITLSDKQKLINQLQGEIMQQQQKNISSSIFFSQQLKRIRGEHQQYRLNLQKTFKESMEFLKIKQKRIQIRKFEQKIKQLEKKIQKQVNLKKNLIQEKQKLKKNNDEQQKQLRKISQTHEDIKKQLENLVNWILSCKEGQQKIKRNKIEAAKVILEEIVNQKVELLSKMKALEG